MRCDRVGVTGHRWNRIARESTGALSEALKALFLEIDKNRAVARTLVSGMAEGADMVAAAARPCGWALEAVLPLRLNDWRAHLAAQPGVVASDLGLFDQLVAEAVVVEPGVDVVEPDYLALADHLVATCGVLVAVWDGTAGLPGGTGDVTLRARRRGLDVRILDARPFLIR